MAGSMTTLSGADGSFAAYLATPESGVGPGAVVMQEMFGLNPFVRHVCDVLAAAGYIALGPDLYWRQEPGLYDLTDGSKIDVKHAFALLDAFDVDAGIVDLGTTIAELRSLEGCTGRVGGVGYCLGGLLAYLLVARTDADCAVGYYGVGVEHRLDEAGAIAKPLMLHVADADQTMTPAAIATFTSALADHALVTIHRYPGLDHGFARLGTKYFNYVEDAADLAHRRTLEFLAAHLG